MKKSDALLMFAASDHDANMLYATRLFVPDPFIYLRLGGKSYVVMSDLEIDRARKQAPHCRVLSLRSWQDQVRRSPEHQPGIDEVIAAILRQHRVRQVTVPADFPYGLAMDLQRLRVRVKPQAGAFFPERQLKSAPEISRLTAALRMAEAAMAEGIRVLRAARPGKRGELVYQGATLTSERLRAVIDTVITQAGGVASHTIVAGGKQACDPHESGFGPLRANEPIILDIFPRSQKTGYFGDITRTVVRGRASEAVRKLYATVQEGQRRAFQQMRAGVPTRLVHQTVLDYFNAAGYVTGKRNGRMQGFFHGTGHGLGLEIHEPPRTGLNSPGLLQRGQVITVEPGLYYPELGGVRLEDVAVVTAHRPRNLTRFEKHLEI